MNHFVCPHRFLSMELYFSNGQCLAAILPSVRRGEERRAKQGGGTWALVGAGARSRPPQANSCQAFASPQYLAQKGSRSSWFFSCYSAFFLGEPAILHFIVNPAHPHASLASLVQRLEQSGHKGAAKRSSDDPEGGGQSRRFYILYSANSMGTDCVPCTVLSAKSGKKRPPVPALSELSGKEAKAPGVS